MAKFKTVNRGGWHWLVAEVNGVRHWLHRQARIGHCFRPGQRTQDTVSDLEDDLQRIQAVSRIHREPSGRPVVYTFTHNPKVVQRHIDALKSLD